GRGGSCRLLGGGRSNEGGGEPGGETQRSHTQSPFLWYGEYTLPEAVPRLQDLHMVPFMSGDHKADGPDADRFTAGSAAAHPGVGVETLEQRQRRGPNGPEVGDQGGQGPVIEFRRRDVRVLVEPRERGL